MNTTLLGNIGESRVLHELVKFGIQCYLPYGDGSAVDLIADFNGKLNKIQIKTTEKLSKVKAMEWRITRQDGYHGNRVKYEFGTIDYFALYCLETDTVCLIPFSDTTSKFTISIRPDDYKGVRRNNMRFASDYSVEKIIRSRSSVG